jgi:hypothetical protein
MDGSTREPPEPDATKILDENARRWYEGPDLSRAFDATVEGDFTQGAETMTFYEVTPESEKERFDAVKARLAPGSRLLIYPGDGSLPVKAHVTAQVDDERGGYRITFRDGWPE